VAEVVAGEEDDHAVAHDPSLRTLGPSIDTERHVTHRRSERPSVTCSGERGDVIVGRPAVHVKLDVRSRSRITTVAVATTTHVVPSEKVSIDCLDVHIGHHDRDFGPLVDDYADRIEPWWSQCSPWG